MNQIRRKYYMIALRCFDVITMITAFIGAAIITSLSFNTVSFHEFIHIRVKIINFVLFLILMLVWQLIFSMFGLYSSRRFSDLRSEAIDVLKSTIAGTAMIFIAAWILKIELVTSVFLVVFLTVTSATTIISRILLRKVLKWIRLHERNIRYLLIVGTNERARKFAINIETKPELGYRLLGFVDNNWLGDGGCEDFDWRLISDFDGIASYIKDTVVDEVVIALPMRSMYQEASIIFSICENQGIVVRNLSDIFTMKHACSLIDDLEGIPILTHYTGSMRGWEMTVKRLLDILTSTILLVVLSPLALVAVLSIKINSPGPALYLQERVGLNKRIFRLIKFRTMVDGADKMQSKLEIHNEGTGPTFKIIDDPRITWIGKILRKTSIDELPQLINVLRGDMSLVGPRPLPVRDFSRFDQDWHRRRFTVRPGITCLWQINGRNSCPFDKWMQLDMHYIDNWSLWLDLTILAKTVPAVLKGVGAA